MSDEVVPGGTPSNSTSLLNTVCRIYSNGSKCANCELQDPTNRGANYVRAPSTKIE